MEHFFLPVTNYEDSYAISDDGVVKSLQRLTNHGRLRKGKVLKTAVGAYGYHLVSLSKNGVVKTYRVHRLVAEAFLPASCHGADVHHRDHDKTNNQVDNLCFVSATENMKAASEAGRLDGLSRGRGRKLSADEVKEIKLRLAQGEAELEIAKIFGVSRRMINYIKNKKVWTGPRCQFQQVNT